MLAYIIRRLVYGMVTLLALSMIVFSLLQMTGGGPLDRLKLNPRMGPYIQTLTELWGLDQPLHVQYLVYINNIIHGNFGVSIKWPGRSTKDLILSRLPATLQLSALSLVVAAVIAVAPATENCPIRTHVIGVTLCVGLEWCDHMRSTSGASST
ncbi:MAG: ABC transporter permease [Chloroflexi bacterium]|nr:ABC transporter permease [Chloroflexota bacterium]